jgi:hypothetical protein
MVSPIDASNFDAALPDEAVIAPVMAIVTTSASESSARFHARG